MKTPTPGPRSRRGMSVGRVLFIAIVALLIVGAVGLYNLVTLSRDAAALRKTLVTANAAEPRLRVQASIGPVLCSVVRKGLRWIDDVPAEAHQALAALRGASVAVYGLTSAASDQTRNQMITTASAEMRRRGWTRTVAVQDGGDLVLVFTPVERGWFGPLRVCVAVCSGEELIVAEARLAEHELAAFIAKQVPNWRPI